jgi:hypothetical protein
MLESFRFGDVETIAMGDANKFLARQDVRVIKCTGALTAQRTLTLPVRSGADYLVIVDTTGYGLNVGPGVSVAAGTSAVVAYDGSAWRAVTTSANTYDIHALTLKSSPVDADEIGISDSAATWSAKKTTLAQIKNTISGLTGDVTGTPAATTVSAIQSLPIGTLTPDEVAPSALAYDPDTSEMILVPVVDRDTYDDFTMDQDTVNYNLSRGVTGTYGGVTIDTTATATATATWSSNLYFSLGEFWNGPTNLTNLLDPAETIHAFGFNGNEAYVFGLDAETDLAIALTAVDDTKWVVGTWRAFLNDTDANYGHLIDRIPYRSGQANANKSMLFDKKISNVYQRISGTDYLADFMIGGENLIVTDIGGGVLSFTYGNTTGWRAKQTTRGGAFCVDGSGNARKSNWSGARGTVSTNQYFLIHYLAHQTGVIAVMGSEAQATVLDTVCRINGDMRAAWAQACFTAGNYGTLTTNLIPLGSCIYKQTAPNTFVLQTYQGQQIWSHLHSQHELACGSTWLKPRAFSDTTPGVNYGIPYGCSHGATEVSIFRDATEYVLNAVSTTHAVTGSVGGAASHFTPFQVAGLQANGTTLKFRFRKPQNASSDLHVVGYINAHITTGGSTTHWASGYDLTASSSGTDIDLSTIYSTGSTPFSGPVVTSDANYIYVTFTTNGAKTNLDVRGHMQITEWRYP